MKQPLRVKLNNREGVVERSDYVTAKTKDMRAFGYDGLSEKEVDEQITAIQEGKKFGEGLTVVGKFMEDEISVHSGG